MNFKPALLAAATFLALNAHANEVDPVAIAQWSFNTGSTKHDFSMNGAQFATLGGVTTSFNSQTGSSDTNAGQALNTTTYGSATTGNMTRGVQFSIDTSGYQNLVFSFDQRNSNAASAWTALLYTVDGTDWLKATEFKMAAGETWVKQLSYDFGSILGANNNASFAVRLVSMFAPGTNSYLKTSSTTASYQSNGTIRYDMVTLTGSEIIAAPVPEASTTAMMLAGLLAVGVVVRRRRQG